MIVPKATDEELDLIEVTSPYNYGYGDGIKVPRRILMLSPVWKDALDIGSLPKRGIASEPQEKKRKTEPKFQTDMPILTAKLVFRLLDERYAPSDQDDDPFFISSDYTVDQIIRAADQYEIPQIVPRLFSQLWQLATVNKEAALFAFSAAFGQKDAALARFAIQNFKALCHPVYFSDKTYMEINGRAWRFLIRAVHGLGDGTIDWSAVAESVVFPADWKVHNQAWETLGLAIKVKQEPILRAPTAE